MQGTQEDRIPPKQPWDFTQDGAPSFIFHFLTVLELWSQATAINVYS